MKKLFLLGMALLSGLSLAVAQPADSAPSHAKSFYISLQGGPVLDIYENAFSYRENGRNLELIKYQGSLALGYDFSDSFGLRLSGAYGSDAGACNVRQTSGGGFYPYTFRHVTGFLDGIINLNGLAGNITYFRPKLYAGLGGAHTFGFTDPGHPWQRVTPKNNAFGFRLGFIAEYTFKSGFGIFADLCGEGWTDNYNGLKPSKEDQKDYEGYAGFPLDLRGLFGAGIVYHF